jgi:pterin-4a-carbinolamine dehydratase
MKSYNYYMKVAKKVASIAEKVEHNYDISINCYHSSGNETPFVTVAVTHDNKHVHFTFYDFRTKDQHKEMLNAIETYLRTGEVVKPAELY